MRKIIILSLISFQLLNAHGQDVSRDEFAKKLNPIITAVPFLTIAPDSRAAGMGDVGVATIPDNASQHWNAAKYNFMKSEFGISISYIPWLKNLGVDDINLLHLSGYKKLDLRQTVSASLRYFSLGNILFTDFTGEPLGNFNPNEWAIDAGYGLKLSNYLSGSITFRFIYSNLTGGISSSGDYKAGIAGAADFGLYYQRDIEIQDKSSQMAFGLNLSNIGNKVSYDEVNEPDFLPINLRLGGRLTHDLDEYNSLSVALDINKYLVPSTPIYNDSLPEVIEAGYDPNVSVPLGMFQSFYDAPGGIKEEFKEIMYSLGLEYWYREQFAIRAGYFHENQNKGNRKFLTVGTGFKLNVFGLDLSYLIPTSGKNSALANTVRFTLTFDFDQSTKANAF